MRQIFEKYRQFNRDRGQIGIAIYSAVAVLSIVMAIALGVGMLAAGQLKMLNEAGNSVVAFGAAESGIEWSLTPWYSGDYVDASNYQNACPLDDELALYVCAENVSLGEAVYTVNAYACGTDSICIKSVGRYRGAQRALKIQM